MRVSTASILSFSAWLATAAASMNLEDIPQWSTHEYLQEYGFYDGRIDHQLKELKAAYRRSDLGKRDDGIRLIDDLEMLFAQNENEAGGVYGKNPVYRVRVNGKAKQPVLLLEKFDSHMDVVECNNDMVSLRFNNPLSFAEAKKTLAGKEGATVITSHPGCNEDGERRPFAIERIRSQDDEDMIDLKVSKRDWKQVYSKMSMEYGLSDEAHVLRTNDIRRREYQPSWTQKNFPGSAPVPSGTPSSTEGEVDLAWESSDEEWKLPSIITNHIDGSITVGCNECTQEGTAKFTQGQFDFDFDITDPSWDFVTGGWFQVDVTGYKAHMDMYATPTVSLYLWQPIVEIPFPSAGFKIKGFGKAGVFFSPAVLASIGLSKPVELNFGFEVTAPDSTLRVDLGDFANSELSGFQDAEVTGLPFSANESDPTITVTGALMPRIPIGIEIGDTDDDGGLIDGGVKAEVGMFVSTPRFDFAFSEGCGPTANDTAALAVRQSGDVMIKQETKWGLDGGFDASAQLKLGFLDDPGIFTRVTLLSTSFTLPSVCYTIDGSDWGVAADAADATPASEARIVDRKPIPAAAPAAHVTPAPKVAVPFGA